MISEKEIENVKNIIVNEVNPEKVIVFGSYAEGTAGADSDLDLLVIKDSPLPRYKRGLSIRKALRGLGIPLDVVVYTPQEVSQWKDVSNSFITSIISKGKVLYNDKQ